MRSSRIQRLSLDFSSRHPIRGLSLVLLRLALLSGTRSATVAIGSWNELQAHLQLVSAAAATPAKANVALSTKFVSNYSNFSEIKLTGAIELNLHGNGAVLDAFQLGRFFDVQNGAVLNIFGPLTFVNGTADGNFGGSIRVGSFSSLSAINVTFREGRAESGGAISVNQSRVNLTSSTFSYNTATLSGGAIFAESASLQLKNNRFVANKARRTFYVNIRDNQCPILISSAAMCYEAGLALGLITDTSAVEDDPLSWMFDPPGCYYEDSKLKFNTGSNTGTCLALGADSCLCIEHTPVGGALFAYNGTLRLLSNVFTSNSASQGGAAYLDHGSTASLNGNSFLLNAAESNGGAVLVRGSSRLNFEKALTKFEGNNATSGPEVYRDNTSHAVFMVCEEPRKGSDANSTIVDRKQMSDCCSIPEINVSCPTPMPIATHAAPTAASAPATAASDVCATVFAAGNSGVVVAHNWTELQAFNSGAAAQSNVILSANFTSSDFSSPVQLRGTKELNLHGNGVVLDASQLGWFFDVQEGARLRLCGPLVVGGSNAAPPTTLAAEKTGEGNVGKCRQCTSTVLGDIGNRELVIAAAAFVLSLLLQAVIARCRCATRKPQGAPGSHSPSKHSTDTHTNTRLLLSKHAYTAQAQAGQKVAPDLDSDDVLDPGADDLDFEMEQDGDGDMQLPAVMLLPVPVPVPAPVPAPALAPAPAPVQNPSRSCEERKNKVRERLRRERLNRFASRDHVRERRSPAEDTGSEYSYFSESFSDIREAEEPDEDLAQCTVDSTFDTFDMSAFLMKDSKPARKGSRPATMQPESDPAGWVQYEFVVLPN